MTKRMSSFVISAAVFTGRNGESGNEMRGMMGMREIRVGMWGAMVRMRGIRVGMREIGVGMQGMGVRMRGIRVGMSRGIKKEMSAFI